MARPHKRAQLPGALCAPIDEHASIDEIIADTLRTFDEIAADMLRTLTERLNAAGMLHAAIPDIVRALIDRLDPAAQKILLVDLRDHVNNEPMKQCRRIIEMYGALLDHTGERIRAQTASKEATDKYLAGAEELLKLHEKISELKRERQRRGSDQRHRNARELRDLIQRCRAELLAQGKEPTVTRVQKYITTNARELHMPKPKTIRNILSELNKP